jgi:hypothetical protein
MLEYNDVDTIYFSFLIMRIDTIFKYYNFCIILVSKNNFCIIQIFSVNVYNAVFISLFLKGLCITQLAPVYG